MRASWDDFRIAYQVAKSGSLNKAGLALQMNHATVLRHINQLENALGIKLFIRHQRGYRLSEAGELMVNQLPKINQQFSQLEDSLTKVEQNISGNLRITTVPDHPPLLNPALKAFRRAYPQLRIEIIATDEILSLAKGEAHVAIRAGRMPNEPDLVVRPLTNLNTLYYAAQSYIDEYGLPRKTSEFNDHFWALPSAEKRRIPFVKAVLSHIDEQRIVYQSNSFQDIAAAVIEGLAIGPVAKHKAQQYQHLKTIESISIDNAEGLWFVYHKDLKSSKRIQTLWQYINHSLIG